MYKTIFILTMVFFWSPYVSGKSNSKKEARMIKSSGGLLNLIDSVEAAVPFTLTSVSKLFEPKWQEKTKHPYFLLYDGIALNPMLRDMVAKVLLTIPTNGATVKASIRVTINSDLKLKLDVLSNKFPRHQMEPEMDKSDNAKLYYSVKRPYGKISINVYKVDDLINAISFDQD